MIVYRLEHTICPEGESGHGPVRAPNKCRGVQSFGTYHTGPEGDPWQSRQDPNPCRVCRGTGAPQTDWESACYRCDGKGRTPLYINITDEQICGVTAEQLHLWCEGVFCEPQLHSGWQVIIYRVDGRFRWTRRGKYQVVFRRQDADIVGRITNKEQLEPLLRAPKPGVSLDTALRKQWSLAA